MHTLNLFFSWPNGSIWGNIVATLLTSIPLWVLGYNKLKKRQQHHHEQLVRQLNEHYTKLTDTMTNNGN
jgi:hypothetical protein